MKAWLWKHKGYILHAAAVLVIFLNPSVEAYFKAHLLNAGALSLAWGFLLHWAEGK